FFTHHTEYRSEFAIHFSPVLLLVYPFFTLHPEPLTLYIASAVGLSLAVPLAYRFLKPDWGEGPAALLAFGAVLFPSILSLYSDFSPVRFAPPAIWLVILAYKSGDMKKFAAAFLVCLLVKETLPLAIFMISGVALLQKKKMNWIIIPGLVSIVAFLFINSVLIPWFADTPNKTSTIAAQFGYWGQTAPSVIIGFLKDPVSVITALSRPNNFAYALKLGHGVLFLLPLGSPLVLLAIPEFFVNTLAGYNPAILPYYYTGPWTSFLGHYSATIGTVLWAAACDSFVIKEVSETNTEDLQRSRWVRACLLFVAVLSTVIYPTNAENIL
ncbi:MAG: DUF2079 domain-containing protein, partial [Candidatus Lindowbacteria bacterium]|nr:DUF2079 domain-containing protein [Candidatus Lindowbacteria bacterium]